jgi:hypothetical protein
MRNKKMTDEKCKSTRYRISDEQLRTIEDSLGNLAKIHKQQCEYTKFQAVKKLSTKIKLLQNIGLTMDQIVIELEKNGLQISKATFATYLNRLKINKRITQGNNAAQGKIITAKKTGKDNVKQGPIADPIPANNTAQEKPKNERQAAYDDRLTFD